MLRPQVAVLGLASDPPCELLLCALAERGADVLLLDQGQGTRSRSVYALDADGLHGTCSHTDRVWRLEALQGLYLRPQDDAVFLREPARLQQARNWTQTWIELGELLPARVLNPLSAMGSNSSKPFQSQLLAEAGFAVPPMLMSNVPEEVLAFEAQHGELIYKSASGVRSIVQVLDARSRARLDAIRHCPTLFQKRLHGKNVRVHVVGQAMFATAIDSDVVDYRYAGRQGGSTSLRATRLDAHTRECCLRASKLLGLAFTGLDLMQADDGLVYCFEANPSPGYSYYEHATGQPIAAELASYLCGLG
jgi:glutathione synthase/RimK-type ligase-like ATP-grasp enzyme